MNRLTIFVPPQVTTRVIAEANSVRPVPARDGRKEHAESPEAGRSENTREGGSPRKVSAWRLAA
jgi:hypothetical protein